MHFIASLFYWMHFIIAQLILLFLYHVKLIKQPLKCFSLFFKLELIALWIADFLNSSISTKLDS